MVRACSIARVPLTVAGGRSGVCGAAIPVFGGVVLDTTALSGVVSVDDVSGIVEVMGRDVRPRPRATFSRTDHGLSVGHFPAELRPRDGRRVGGISWRRPVLDALRQDRVDGGRARSWCSPTARSSSPVARRPVPSGRISPSSSSGPRARSPIITKVWLRTHPVPPDEARAAYSFATFGAGIEACRATSCAAGATPAVLRLYDAEESARGRGGDGSNCMMVVLDEGDRRLVDATMAIVDESCACGRRVTRRCRDWSPSGWSTATTRPHSKA